MSNVHKCTLPKRDTTGFPKLAPNASPFQRMARKFRRLIILNPKNFRCRTFFMNKSAMIAEQRRHISSYYNYIIHPFSDLNVVLELTFFVVWFTRMIYIPLIMSMMSELRSTTSFDLYCSVLFQPLVIVSFFFVGYVDRGNKEVVIEHGKIVLRYVSTYFFFDLATTKVFSIASHNFVEAFVKDELRRWRMSMLMYYMDAWCLYVRLPSVLRYLDDLAQTVRLWKRVRKCLRYLLRTFMYLHIFSCTLYMVPQLVYGSDWPSDSWIVIAKIEPDRKAPYQTIYAECFLMTICYFFGASPGAYTISQTNEQICVSFIGLFGRLYTLFLLADVLHLFGIATISESNYERHKMKMKQYMIHNNLPTQTRHRMVAYREHKLQKRYFNEAEILNSLSVALRAEIFLFSSKQMVRKANIFKYLQHADMATLISMMRLLTFAPGDVIIKPDDPLYTIYFISSGSIAVLTRGWRELCHLEDGDVFGLCMALLDEHNYYGVAVEATDVFAMSLKELTTFLSEYADAQQYLYDLAKKKRAMYKLLQRNLSAKDDTCIMELRKGALLERRKKRKIVAE